MRLREQVLKVAATLTVHARRVALHLGAAADNWWPPVAARAAQIGCLVLTATMTAILGASSRGRGVSVGKRAPPS